MVDFRQHQQTTNGYSLLHLHGLEQEIYFTHTQQYCQTTPRTKQTKSTEVIHHPAHIANTRLYQQTTNRNSLLHLHGPEQVIYFTHTQQYCQTTPRTKQTKSTEVIRHTQYEPQPSFTEDISSKHPTATIFPKANHERQRRCS